jgi:hypothetical protein
MLITELLTRAGNLTPADIVLKSAKTLTVGDVEHGVLPDELKRLYVICGQLYDKYRSAQRRALQLTMEDGGNEEEIATIEKRLEAMRNKAQRAEELFWSEVKYVFPAADNLLLGNALTIREDWRVVSRAADPLEIGLHIFTSVMRAGAAR